MSIASREPGIQLAIDRSSPSPSQQTYSDWNQRTSERFLLILGYVLSTGLSYWLVFIPCQELACTQRYPCRKFFIVFEASNCWISNHSYIRTEESVKTERDISYRTCRMAVEQKRNVNFILTATVPKQLIFNETYIQALQTPRTGNVPTSSISFLYKNVLLYCPG